MTDFWKSQFKLLLYNLYNIIGFTVRLYVSIVSACPLWLAGSAPAASASGCRPCPFDRGMVVSLCPLSFQCVHAIRKPFLDRLCFCFHTGFLSLIGSTVSAIRYRTGSGRYVSISRVTVSACVTLWLSLSAVLSLYLFTVFTVFTKLSIYYKLTLFYLYIFLSKYDEHDEQSKKNTVNIGVSVFTGSVHWLFTGCVHWLNL